MTDFDYDEWAAQGRANAAKLPDSVAEALGPERDWADEVFNLATNSWGSLHQPNAPRRQLAVAVIRKMCRPIGNDKLTDEWLADARRRIVSSQNLGGVDACIETLRAIIAEASQ